MALSVPLLAQFSPEPIDIARASLLATVHDICESFVGDTFAFGPDKAGQHSRERAAMEALRASSSSPAIQLIVDLWEEYEDQATPEARFVKGMDAFLPILLNFTNVKNSSWTEHKVEADQVRRRLDRARASISSLAKLNDQMIDQAQVEGYLM
jgi:putative hydrolases of HD superfamily